MNFVVENTVLAQVIFNFVAGVDNGGVVAAAEFVSYGRKRDSEVFPQEKHDDLPRAHHLFAPGFFVNTPLLHSIKVCDGFDHLLHGDRLLLYASCAAQERLGVVYGVRLATHLKLDHKRFKSPLKLAPVALDGGRKILQHLVRKDKVVRGGLASDDGKARLVVRGRHRHYHAGIKAAFEPVLEVLDDVGVLVGGKDELFVGVVEVVKEVEELFFDFVPAGEKLDVVHDEEVILAVLLFKRLYLPRLERGHVVHGKLFRRAVVDLALRRAHTEVVADGLDKVRFA